MEPILAEWEDNARNDWVGMTPDVATLRDHAVLMLRAVVEDMASSQTAAEQKTKSEGSDDRGDSGINSAAVKHAIARINDGFEIERMIAEFRALRASVSRVWWESQPAPHRQEVEDMGRFNEALDQLVAVSVTAYTARVEHNRRLFLGILGHDLRQPLAAARMMAFTMRASPGLSPETSEGILARIERCCDTMSALLNDLLDFTTTQLRSAMPVIPVRTDLASLCGEIIDEIRATAPAHTLILETTGPLTGEWDPARLRQLLSNLLMNAVIHGSRDSPIISTLSGGEVEVILSVHNCGGTIPQEAIAVLMDPTVRIVPNEEGRSGDNIGLGLYICRQIAHALGGVIGVESSVEKGSTITVTLPKQYSPQDHPEI